MKDILFKPAFWLSLMISLSIVKKSSAAELIIAADNWCPISCKPNTDEQGFMVEMAEVIFQKKGHTVKYIQLPWNRAVLMARSGKIDGIIGAFHGDAPDFVFPDNEQAVLTNVYYTLKNSELDFSRIDNKLLQKNKLGIVAGYDYGPSLMSYIKPTKQENILLITGDKNLTSRLLALLELKRVDVIVEVDFVVKYEIAKQSKEKLFKQIGLASKPLKAYIAFSPNKPKSLEYSKILSDGMEEIKKSGEIDLIMNNYGLASNHYKK
ncbi:MAG: transporter substrate-binding domain-containing protein [Colwellia sp.]